jgi:predicted dehydrogenase
MGQCFIVLGAGQGMGRQVTHALRAGRRELFCVDLDAERASRVAQETGGVA